jgi:hypothetical protein
MKIVAPLANHGFDKSRKTSFGGKPHFIRVCANSTQPSPDPATLKGADNYLNDALNAAMAGKACCGGGDAALWVFGQVLKASLLTVQPTRR